MALLCKGFESRINDLEKKSLEIGNWTKVFDFLGEGLKEQMAESENVPERPRFRSRAV